jgi:hypothetical protein
MTTIVSITMISLSAGDRLGDVVADALPWAEPVTPISTV